MHKKTRRHLSLMLLALAITMPLMAAPIDRVEPPARAWTDVSGWVSQWWGALTDAWSTPTPRSVDEAAAKDGASSDDDDDATRHYLQIEPGG